ncbi:hypothetical protein K7432_010171, partial [Basidiobolus ranarum]
MAIQNEVVDSSQNFRLYAKNALNSCVIRQMTTCALRSNERNDIIFAKETCLQLLQVNSDGILTSLLEQHVFGTIKDMKLLRCSFTRESNTSESEKSTKSSYSKLPHLPGKIPGDDVLVFLSDSGVLSFVSYEELELGRGKFSIVKELYLAPPGLGHKNLGRLLCVDPLSRALAVASWQDSVKLYILNQHQSRENFEPVKEEKLIEIKGIIWNMAFLYPAANEKERLLLALVVV